MKKCPYCGKEYPDDASICPTDEQPLVSLRDPTGPPPIPPMPSTVPPPVPRQPAIAAAPVPRAAPPMPVIAIIAIALGACFFGVFVLAVLAGLTLPALAKAKAKASQINCANNLRQIAVASHSWASANNDHLPFGLIELSNRLAPNILVCPADRLHTRTPAGAPVVWNSANITYEYLTPGASLDSVRGQVIVRCPIHGTELFGDGTVHFTNRTRSYMTPPNSSPSQSQ
jgi:hypothetical protein